MGWKIYNLSKRIDVYSYRLYKFEKDVIINTKKQKKMDNRIILP